jgi:CcmD family protein
MSDFLSNPSIAIYTAMAVALVVWVALFAFLWRLDSQARELRRKIDQAPSEERTAPRATLESRAPRPAVVEDRRSTADDRALTTDR